MWNGFRIYLTIFFNVSMYLRSIYTLQMVDFWLLFFFLILVAKVFKMMMLSCFQANSIMPFHYSFNWLFHKQGYPFNFALGSRLYCENSIRFDPEKKNSESSLQKEVGYMNLFSFVSIHCTVCMFIALQSAKRTVTEWQNISRAPRVTQFHTKNTKFEYCAAL